VLSDSGTPSGNKANQIAPKLVRKAGGRPVLLQPPYNASQDIDGIDALMVLGRRWDVNPQEYGEEEVLDPDMVKDGAHTDYEKAIIPLALIKRMPVLGLCAGMQRIQVVLGGRLEQKISDHRHGDNAGHPWASDKKFLELGHIPITIVEGTHLAEIRKGIQGQVKARYPDLLYYEVKCFHHQAIRANELVPGLKAAAHAQGGSGTIEAFEADPKGKYRNQYIMGFQFHIERMLNDPFSKALFKDFIVAAEKYKQRSGSIGYQEQESNRRENNHGQIR